MRGMHDDAYIEIGHSATRSYWGDIRQMSKQGLISWASRLDQDSSWDEDPSQTRDDILAGIYEGYFATDLQRDSEGWARARWHRAMRYRPAKTNGPKDYYAIEWASFDRYGLRTYVGDGPDAGIMRTDEYTIEDFPNSERRSRTWVMIRWRHDEGIFSPTRTFFLDTTGRAHEALESDVEGDRHFRFPSVDLAAVFAERHARRGRGRER